MDISQRINRIIGQLKGIQKKTESQRDCGDILQQVTAVKKAIDGLSKEIVVCDVCQHVPQANKKRVEQMMERAINL